jgi:hypothetical protein
MVYDPYSIERQLDVSFAAKVTDDYLHLSTFQLRRQAAWVTDKHSNRYLSVNQLTG